MTPQINLITKIILNTATAEDFFSVCGKSFNTLYNIFNSDEIFMILHEVAGITVEIKTQRIRFMERNWVDVRYEIYSPSPDIIGYIKHNDDFIYNYR